MKAATWKKLADGRWTAHLGTRGHSVRLHQLSADGVFYRDIGGGSNKDRRSLRTRDRAEALEIGKQILAELLRHPSETDEPAAGVVTLRSLWDRYRTLCAEWLDNSDSSRRDDEHKAKVLLGFFGDSYDVMRLCANEQKRYESARRTGFTMPDGKQLSPVRQGTVWADIVLLQSMLRWAATKYKTPSGQPLLKYNPLAGVKNTKETMQNRPIVTQETHEQLVRATQELATTSKQPVKWRLLELYLLTVNETGRRGYSVRHLRWQDINHFTKEITWRAKYDKKGREQTIPISDILAEELQRVHKESGWPTDGWIFPAVSNNGKPVDKKVFWGWLKKAEEHAKLPRIKGGGFHTYRRKFASERQEEPVKQVMDLGGWRDQKTMMTCYVQVNSDQLRALLNQGIRRSA
jgi:integrase